ncbi:hypothetical protein AX16_007679 [Volvariella volvacea WC 439]|nr:hypothetical protein AX16_007679 [Volvariella volvacea WC 439]
MPPRTVYSGALPPKKKAELQELANALHLSDQGTKEELQIRIKKHLDLHQAALEENPVFAGLFGRRRKGSVQPQPAPASAAIAGPDAKPLSTSSTRSAGRISKGLDAVEEAAPPTPSTPHQDLGDVSHYLKHPISPSSTPAQSPDRSLSFTRQQAQPPATPQSLPLLPPSSPSPARTVALPQSTAPVPPASPVPAPVRKPAISEQEQALNNGIETFVAFREFLSNSRNIWSLTAVAEFIRVLYVVIPWKQYDIALKQDTPLLSLYYPPLETFTSSAFWTILLHWALPTLVIPAIFGTMISFHPTPSRPSTSDDGTATRPRTAPIAPFDPLTASIARVAIQYIYPYDMIQSSVSAILIESYGTAIQYGTNLDVIGLKIRMWTASVGLLFALAEQIAKAPERFAQSVLKAKRREDKLRLNEGQRGVLVEQLRCEQKGLIQRGGTERTLFEE